MYGTGIAVGHMTKYGLGRHIYVMELENIPLYLRVSVPGSQRMNSRRVRR